MTHAVLADTGPLYAAADSDDAHHNRAQRELRRLAREGRDVLVAYPTLLEAHALVLRRLGRRAAATWLDEVLKSSALIAPVVDDYLEGVMKLNLLSDQSITLFDATLSAVGERLHVEIWTYDHHFDLMRAKVWR